VQHCNSVVSNIYSMAMIMFGKLSCVLVTSSAVQRVDVLETKMKAEVVAWCVLYVLHYPSSVKVNSVFLK